MDQNPILLNLEKVLNDNHIPVIDKSKLGIKGKIQKGGQGSVYKGTLSVSNGENQFERPVAIKVIQVTYDNLLNTMRELQFLAKGKQLCNTLITIYGITIDQGEEQLINCMIVMELMTSNLQDYIYKVPESQKPLKEKLRILQQIADCLVFLHSHGIVHRDIKPLNILLDEGNNVFVTDLGYKYPQIKGFSRLMDKGTNIMETQHFSGTVRHASPELFLDNKYNTLSDMWCFGIVVYEMFICKAPWDGQSFNYRCFIEQKLPLIEGWEQMIQNEKIQNLIKGCVCYDLQTRWTAGQVKSILVSLLWRSSTGTVDLP